ncbi:MAG: biopolymer transporter ExbD [Thiomargarita sp.]|nr:biopolymer transporter ExbD [Thiomargarita sp.]
MNTNFDNFDERSNQAMSEINMIPLIDVMLVLLILFIITAPLLTVSGLQVDIPQTSHQENFATPSQITLILDETGDLFWNDKKISLQNLEKLLQLESQKKIQPEVHLRADKKTQYQQLAQVMSIAQQVGITKLGFITETFDEN